MEKFSLKWNEHQICASNTFKKLYDDTHFLDVTLILDDEKEIKAHKNILCAVSPFFNKILTRNPHPNPLLYLKSIQSEIFKFILSFVYIGSVEIPESDVKEFFNTAKALQINILTEDLDGATEEFNEENINIEHNYNKCQEPNDLTDEFQIQVPITDESKYYFDVTRNNGSFSCTQCSYETERAYNFKRHLDMHVGVTFSCDQCDNTFSRKSNVIRHKLSKHK